MRPISKYQCSKGHVKCPRCKQKLQSCPQCREVYGTVGIRNLILESITAKLKPKSLIEKKPVRKKHGNNHSGAKRLMQGIGNDIGNYRNRVVAVAVAGKEINPTKHNWKSICEFSEKCLVFVINRVDFCPCPAPMK